MPTNLTTVLHSPPGECHSNHPAPNSQFPPMSPTNLKSNHPLLQVDALISQVAEEHGLEMGDMMAGAESAPTGALAGPSTSVSNEQEDALTRRLAQLRN